MVQGWRSTDPPAARDDGHHKRRSLAGVADRDRRSRRMQLPHVVVAKHVSVLPDQRRLNRADEFGWYSCDEYQVPRAVHRGIEGVPRTPAVPRTEPTRRPTNAQSSPGPVRLHVDAGRLPERGPGSRERREPLPSERHTAHCATRQGRAPLAGRPKAESRACAPRATAPTRNARLLYQCRVGPTAESALAMVSCPDAHPGGGSMGQPVPGGAAALEARTVVSVTFDSSRPRRSGVPLR